MNALNLHVPLKFEIACNIANVELSEAVQTFINYVSAIDIIGDNRMPYCEGYSEAAHVIQTFLFEKEKSRSLKHLCFSEIEIVNTILTLSNSTNLPSPVKRHEAYCHMSRFKTVVPEHKDLVHKIMVNGHQLELATDFKAICKIFQVIPGEVLEYFINNVSFALNTAVEQLKCEFNTASNRFFATVLDTEINLLINPKRMMLKKLLDTILPELEKNEINKMIDQLDEFLKWYYANIAW